LPETAKTVHVIPVIFKSGDRVEPVTGQIVIETDLQGFEKLSVPVLGTTGTESGQ